MTRKEELEELARQFADDWVDHYTVPDGVNVLVALLQHVEREVWQKAAKIVEGGRFITDSSLEAQWAKAVTRLLRQQQEGL